MLAPSKPRSRKTLWAASRIRSSTLPASSFGGRPMRTAARLAEDLPIICLVQAVHFPGDLPNLQRPGGPLQHPNLCIPDLLVNRNETVSFHLTALSAELSTNETRRFRFFSHQTRRRQVMFMDDVPEGSEQALREVESEDFIPASPHRANARPSKPEIEARAPLPPHSPAAERPERPAQADDEPPEARRKERRRGL